ncbi:FAD-binding 8 [Macleaya cordata]|uniref:FAD-binding 8 n=1 Tax=Macleaya cordata TaxID=56857 RepID=A0A200RD19_MACCD|nr:FAD-binding 8 [Macleaya cordata]
MLSTANLQIVLKVLIILISAVWVSLWLLKPTELWTKSWHKAEDGARKTVFGYYGLNFVVYSVPAIAVAIIGFIYLHLYAKEPRRQMRMSINKLSNPFIVYRPLGIISGSELLAVTIFIIFLVWTIYAHLSNDFKKMIPTKSLKLNTWQFKFMKVGTRLGLLAEACLALLLLPVLRGMSLFRLIGIQFEASVRYHICLGTAMILFATLHGTTTFFIWGVKHQIQDEMWLWQKTGRVYLAGELTLVTGLVIWITSLPQIRRKWFEIFYYTHHLYAVFLVLFLLHTGDRHFYMVFSGVLLFGMDKLLRIIQSRPATCIVSARIFPSKAVELSLSKDPRLKYTPTSLIFLKVPSISKLQWHPFSITSSSSVDDERISVIVKGDGWWTNSLYNTILAALDSDPHQVKCLPVHVEGPYGPVSTDFLRYDSLLLVAGGIGITPFLSILQELAFIQNSKKSTLPTRIQLIYAVKKSEDISLLNPISPLLLNQSLGQSSLAVKVFVTQEERSATTLRELLHELSKVQIVNFNSKGLNYTISGFPNLPWLAGIAGFSSIVFLVALGCLNHAFLHSEKKASEKKNPSWVTDVLLICSFIIAITFGALATVIMKQRRTKKDLPPIAVKQCVDTEFGSLESKDILEDHEIHYGERPNFEDIFSQFPNQTGGSNIGVLVCGPESMKESVALSCRQHSQGFITGGGKGRKPYFSFHSLNFAL